jgi:hypothetical protein
MRRLAIVLVHHPVLDGRGGVVMSAITSLDVHDLARSARTFGASDYFLVHPIAVQRELVETILKHWIEGSSGRRIPARKEALALVRTAPSLDAVYDALGGRAAIEVWSTGAKLAEGTIDMPEARARVERDGPPIALLFGTAWGLAPEVHAAADARLAPIVGIRAEYNHLSVRSACAIYLDRLLGAR